MPERSGAVRLEGEYKEALGRVRTMRDLLRFGVSRFNQAQLTIRHALQPSA